MAAIRPGKPKSFWISGDTFTSFGAMLLLPLCRIAWMAFIRTAFRAGSQAESSTVTRQITDARSSSPGWGTSPMRVVRSL